MKQIQPFLRQPCAMRDILRKSPCLLRTLFKYVEYAQIVDHSMRFVSCGSMSPHNEKLTENTEPQTQEISIVMKWIMWKYASDA